MMHRLFFLSLPLVILFQGAIGQTCLDFESLTPGTSYPNGSVFSEADIDMTVNALSPGGFAQIIVNPPGSGNSVLRLNNAEVCFDLVCGENITFSFNNGGGFVSLSINGDSTTLPTFSGSFSLGGTNVSVSGNTVSITGDAVGTLCIGGQELIIDDLCFDPCDGVPECLEFEDLGGKELNPGDSFTEGSTTVTVTDFDGVSGSVQSSGGNLAGGSGAEAGLQKAGLSIDNICSGSITFNFGQADRGVELSVNGDSILANDLDELDGLTIGGTAVSVSAGDVNGVLTGTVTITGPVESIVIGGQEIYIDDLCRQPCEVNCIDFEDEPPGTKFTPGDQFEEDGYTFEFAAYKGGTGQGTIDDLNRAGHLGQDLFLNEAVFFGQFDCIEAFSIHFGQYAGNVIVRINGDTAEVPAMEDLDGVTLGGVLLSVTFNNVSGGTQGVLTGEGDFDFFLIGGQRLYIDHLCLVPCPDPACFGFDFIPLNKIHLPGDLIIEEQTILEVFKFGPGSPSEAVIASGTEAGGFGNELRLRNAGVSTTYPCAASVSFRYAIDSGPVGLSVNGSTLATVAGFQALDGSILGGVTVSVTGTGTGTVTLTGVILSMEIAGTDIRIDSICHTPCPPKGTCLDFEGIAPGDSWFAFQGFSEDGVDIDTFYLFDLGGFVVTPDPLMETATSQQAGYVGQDLRLIDATVQFNFGENCVTNLSLHFGNYGGLVNIQINGDLQQFPDMAAMDGATVGGALLSVTRIPVAGGYTGILGVSGNIGSNFYLGGADFYIDHVCFDNCEQLAIDFFRITDVQDISGTDREYTMEVKLNGPGNIRLRGRTFLGGTWPVQGSAVITPTPGQPNTWDISIIKPASDDRWFFRAEGY